MSSSRLTVFDYEPVNMQSLLTVSNHPDAPSSPGPTPCPSSPESSTAPRPCTPPPWSATYSSTPQTPLGSDSSFSAHTPLASPSDSFSRLRRRATIPDDPFADAEEIALTASAVGRGERELKKSLSSLLRRGNEARPNAAGE